jgi:hypothetical protein
MELGNIFLEPLANLMNPLSQPIGLMLLSLASLRLTGQLKNLLDGGCSWHEETLNCVAQKFFSDPKRTDLYIEV